VYTLITLVLIATTLSLAIKNRRLRRAREHVSNQFDETTLILESLRDGLIETDSQIVATRVNRAAENILGIEASQIVNRPIDPEKQSTEVDQTLAKVLYPPKDAKPETGEQYYSYDIFLTRPKEMKLRIFTIPKTNPHSKILTGYIKIIRDVTIETVVEKHKSDLVSIVSHQLLTPLTGIKWIFKSLLDGDAGTLNPKQAEIIKKGMQAGESTISLVSDILDVTKVEQARFAYKMIPHDIVPFIREILNSRKEKANVKNINIQEQLGISGKDVVFDKERMSIALGNILDNAIDYSPVGGAVAVALQTDGNNMNISVSDKGIGIPATDQERLYSKFYRAENAKRVRTSGTGLGLYLAKHIVDDHGGSVRVNSREGEGSTFTIVLPIVGLPGASI